MDAFGDSGELYIIRNQFFTGQYNKVKEYTVDSFSPENQLKVLEYQIRSLVALGLDASRLIDNGKSRFPDNEAFFQLLSAYNDLISFGTDDSTYFDDVQNPTSELQAVLTAIYLVKFMNDIDQAIELLTNYIDNSGVLRANELEPLLVLVQLHLVKGNFSAANRILHNFQSFPESARDNIIYHVLESWISSIRGETENITSSYYFYDELLSNDFEDDDFGKFKALNSLFALTIKLKHFPEANEILDRIKALELKEVNGDLLANEIVLNYLTGKADENGKLVEQLEAADQRHPFLLERQDKLAKFDEIVAKYAS